MSEELCSLLVWRESHPSITIMGILLHQCGLPCGMMYCMTRCSAAVWVTMPADGALQGFLLRDVSCVDFQFHFFWQGSGQSFDYLITIKDA